jgi:hypothetical protein
MAGLAASPRLPGARAKSSGHPAAAAARVPLTTNRLELLDGNGAGGLNITALARALPWPGPSRSGALDYIAIDVPTRAAAPEFDTARSSLWPRLSQRGSAATSSSRWRRGQPASPGDYLRQPCHHSQFHPALPCNTKKCSLLPSVGRAPSKLLKPLRKLTGNGSALPAISENLPANRKLQGEPAARPFRF